MTSLTLSAEVPPSGGHEVQLSMAALKAAEIAMKRFVAEQPKVDPKTFYVVIDESVTSFTVDFVPNPTAIKQGSEGNENYIEMQSGSGNAHGRNIRYEVSKDGSMILKTIYPR
jgi:hypothetical protein